MLMLLLFSLLFGNPAGTPFAKAERKAVKQVIEDREQAGIVIDLMQQVNKTHKRLLEQTADHVAALQKLDDSPDASEEDYQASLEGLWQDRAEAAERYVDLVFEMRQTMSRSQWELAFTKPEEALPQSP